MVFFLDGAPFPALDYVTNFEFQTDAAVGSRADCLQGDYDSTFTGAIDEVEVFNRALSADEIKDLYDSQK
jgi:hypothetical protein